jgi:hypothetical protein
MACPRFIDSVIGEACTWWCIGMVAFYVLSPAAHGQEQFLDSLANDTRVTQSNLKLVNCGSSINPEPADKGAVLSEACTVEFKDGSHFAATLRYCETFEQCEGAGGKFKDILIHVLRAKKKLEALASKKVK